MSIEEDQARSEIAYLKRRIQRLEDHVGLEDEAPEAEEDEFDPSQHNAEDVNSYLATASDEEKLRVLEAEKKGQNRKSIVGLNL